MKATALFLAASALTAVSAVAYDGYGYDPRPASSYVTEGPSGAGEELGEHMSSRMKLMVAERHGSTLPSGMEQGEGLCLQTFSFCRVGPH